MTTAFGLLPLPPASARQAEWALFKSPQQTDSSEELVGGSQRALLKISKGKSGAPTHHPDWLATHTALWDQVGAIHFNLPEFCFSDFYVLFSWSVCYVFIFFTWALGCKWSTHKFTCSDSTLRWQNLPNSVITWHIEVVRKLLGSLFWDEYQVPLP